MLAIKAHFDGQVFVPDEPVQLPPGEPVVVQRRGEEATSRPSETNDSYLHKLGIDLDPQSLREIIDNAELNIENF